VNHKELVRIGKEYLMWSKGCNPVFCEKGSANISEFPDVIGFTAKDCFIIECKTSISDFRNDLKKPHRIDGGMGNQRYYLFHQTVNESIYEKVKDQIPEGWGILLCHSNRGRAEQLRFNGSKEFERNLQAERDFLRSRILEIQRFGQ